MSPDIHEPQQQHPQDDRPFVERAATASPLGVAAIVTGIVLAIVFLWRFEQFLERVRNDELAGAIQSLEITVVSVWIGIALWGWYLVRDGLERAATARRLDDQQHALRRIEHKLSGMDAEKEQITQKTRSFWNWRRTEST